MRPLLQKVGKYQRLAVFETAARLGSFTAAAKELGMTQPAVTRHIRTLEKTIGVELFLRSANKITPTDLGQRLASYIASGFDLIETGLSELAEHAGTFILATHPGIAQQWLVPRLDQLQDAIGELDLRLWLFDYESELTQGGFDAAIRIGNGKFPGLEAVRLFPEIVVPVATPTLAKEYGLDHNSSAADVYQAPFVHMDDGGQPWMSWSDWLSSFGITLRRQNRRVLYNNYPMVIQQTLAGRGVGLGWRPLVDELLEGGALTTVGPQVTSTHSYYLTWPTGHMTETITNLVAWLKDSALPTEQNQQINNKVLTPPKDQHPKPNKPNPPYNL